jgi:hypothetical protein
MGTTKNDEDMTKPNEKERQAEMHPHGFYSQIHVEADEER